jgi:HAD superfamily hydrolase (TIGR01484 family)
MRYLALACDYDGTLAHDGLVAESTLDALQRLLTYGRRLVMVTGRELDDLGKTFTHLHLFERIVVENGGLLYAPSAGRERLLAEPPPQTFIDRLRARGVAPVSVGRVIVATWHPFENIALDTIREMGLELQVIFNKGAVMILPTGVNKATGLSAALEEMSLYPGQVVGVGDAENDHAFLSLCGVSAAVANALPAIKERADIVLQADHGAGVVELIDRMIKDDLRNVKPA